MAYIHFFRRIFATNIVCFGICFAVSATAQTSFDPESESLRQFRQEQDRQDLQRRQLQPQPDVRLPLLSDTQVSVVLPEAESPCFEIHNISFTVTDAGQQNWDWLAQHIQLSEDTHPVLGRCLGAQGIGAIMARLQQAVVQQGWTTTRIIAPPQDLSQGVLQFEILEGVVREIRFADGHGKRATRFNTLPLREGDLLNLRDLEQGLENFKRVPTVAADISIEPGAQPGESDLLIRHTQMFPFRVHASVDDSGSSTTGKYQGSLTLSYDNWWTLSDLFYITWQSELGGKDAGERGNTGHSLHYSVPWGYNLLSLNSSSSKYNQTVAGAFQEYVYSGRNELHDVQLSRIVQRDQAGKTTAAVRAFHRRSHNYIDDTEIEVQRRAVSGIDISLGHRRSLGQGRWEATLTHRQGINAWGSLSAPEEAFGEGTARMRLWLLDASFSTPFHLGSQPWNYHGRLRAQRHQTRLTPQDRFSIGGRYTVRGFDGDSVLSAESGIFLRNEVSTQLGFSPYSVYLGLDLGRVSGPSVEHLVGRQLTGAVVGLRSYWKTGRVQSNLDLFVGQPITKPDGFRTASSVFGFSLNTQF
ncbi:ShlB/FhaC/HecB family hemolysin secretion/activation protein [Nitrincola sp.]|uniref:ShlB/FhaC/HecB family hemolysin secretion/activation protein n=1 Tax=Nitrincola sp. TaxID=1926584 RepID=UPI003A9482E7